MSEIPTIVFVCEHGSAKSVIAATHLNRLACEGHLKLRAVSRGTDPDQAIPPHVLQGLSGDGLTPDALGPGRLSPSDLAGASRIIAFCDIPNEYESRAPVEQWTDVPPVSQGYGPAREVIVQHVTRLLDELCMVTRRGR